MIFVKKWVKLTRYLNTDDFINDSFNSKFHNLSFLHVEVYYIFFLIFQIFEI